MQALRTFLAGPTGATLLRRGRAVHYDTAARACADLFHTQHSAGVAVGFGQCLDWLEKLSRSCRGLQDDGPASRGTDTATPGEPALRELLSPTTR